MILPTSKVFAPDNEMHIETCAPVFSEYNRSAQRPPQPVLLTWSGIEVCHWTCWSLCEKSCGGTAALPDEYCALVNGPTSVPTLQRIANFLSVSKSDCSPAQDACNPRLRVYPLGWIASSELEGSARF